MSMYQTNYISRMAGSLLLNSLQPGLPRTYDLKSKGGTHFKDKQGNVCQILRQKSDFWHSISLCFLYTTSVAKLISAFWPFFTIIFCFI